MRVWSSGGGDEERVKGQGRARARARVCEGQGKGGARREGHLERVVIRNLEALG